jgi:hypothetical protein
MSNSHRILVGKPEGKIPIRRPRRRGKDNIKLHPKETGYEDMDKIHPAQDRDHDGLL